VTSPSLLGWILPSWGSFGRDVFLRYQGRSIIVTGPNGVGKSSLVRAVVNRASLRVYGSAATELLGYLAAIRQRGADRLDNGVESVRELDGSDLGLWELGEDTPTDESDRQWLAEQLGVEQDSVVFILDLAKNESPALAIGIERELPRFDKGLRIPISRRHARLLREQWVVPEERYIAELSSMTEQSFRRWYQLLLEACGVRGRPLSNPLVVTVERQGAIAILELAARWAAGVAQRASQRLERLVGFRMVLGCDVGEGFRWTTGQAGSEVPLEGVSRAMVRWASLAIQETLREAELVMRDRPTVEWATSQDYSWLNEERIYEQVRPIGPTEVFATRDSWVMLDEPEIHLFPSELGILADALAGHAEAGRTVIATHSLDFAARFVGHADFITFDAPGSYIRYGSESPVQGLLAELTKRGPGILARTRVLYVEGLWDQRLLEELFASELQRANVLLAPMHGVKTAEIVAASIWQRMLGLPFGVMFDGLRAVKVQNEWNRWLDELESEQSNVERSGIVERLRTMSATRKRSEDKAILRLFAALIDGRLEHQVTFVMHGLGDIFQVMSPEVFGLSMHEGWNEAHWERSNFKEWIKANAGIDLTEASVCWDVFRRFQRLGSPTDKNAYGLLRDALLGFLNDGA
jgi:hypothetical protein